MAGAQYLDDDRYVLPALSLLPRPGPRSQLLSQPVPHHAPETHQQVERSRHPDLLRQGRLPPSGQDDVRCRSGRPQRVLRGLRHVHPCQQVSCRRLRELHRHDHTVAYQFRQEVHAEVREEARQHHVHRRPHHPEGSRPREHLRLRARLRRQEARQRRIPLSDEDREVHLCRR